MAQTSKEYKRVLRMRVNRITEALAKNNILGFYASDTEDLFGIVDSLVKDDKFMTQGGSTTLVETGLLDYLTEKYGGKFVDREKVPAEAWFKSVLDGFSYDTFFASCNAVTEKGEIVQVDGVGSRIAPIIFGPKQVILVTGMNKVVPDVDAAFSRIRNIAAPCNALRMGRNNPCGETGTCQDCSSDGRICSNYLVMRKQIFKNRIKVILMPDSYGY